MRINGGRACREIAQRQYDAILADTGVSLTKVELPELPDREPALERLQYEAVVAIAFCQGPMTLKFPDSPAFAIPESWHAQARALIMPSLSPKLRAALVAMQNGWRSEKRVLDRITALRARVERGEIETIEELEIAARAALENVA